MKYIIANEEEKKERFWEFSLKDFGGYIYLIAKNNEGETQVIWKVSKESGCITQPLLDSKFKADFTGVEFWPDR